MPQDTLRINNEKPTEGDTFLLDENTVISGDVHVTIFNKWQLEIRTEAAFFTRTASPRKVAVTRVGGYTKDLSVEFSELVEGIVEGEDFRWTNKSKVPESTQVSAIVRRQEFSQNVHWVKEQNDPVRRSVV